MTAAITAATTAAASNTPVLVVGTHSIHVRRFVAGLCNAGQPVVLVTDRSERLVEHPMLLGQLLADFSVISLGTAATIRRAIAQWRPRIVHAHQANSVAWHASRACRGLDTPLVVTLWGSDVLLLPSQGILKRLMVRTALRRASLWTADAAELLRAARAVAGVDRPGAHVVIGVDDPPDDLREIWPHKEARVLSCRAHKPLYRVDAIIQAFAEVAARPDGWQLEVAGSGDGTDTLRGVAAALGSSQPIEFSGQLDAAALSRSFDRARVFVSFPVSDGTSVSLLEAMAHGCVPVVSDLPAYREWIVDGLNGLVVSQPEGLAPAIERAMEWSQSQEWREQAAPGNHRLVMNKAVFGNNVRQFLEQYRRLGR
jgi:glycosyltransferase involved in cell wall biosynthesis